MLAPAEDSSAASWIPENLHGFAQDVGSVVPPVLPAYLRLFHPAWVGGEDGRSVAWSEVASANERTVHPEMQFHAVVPAGYIDRAGNTLDHQRGLWESPPEEGSLDRKIIERLLPALREHTRTPDRCWFAFWDGWGIPVRLTKRKGLFSRAFGRVDDQPDQGPLRDRWDAPKFSIPSRELLLFSGRLDDALESFYEPFESGDLFQSAYFWWPEDRAWFVATEIDLMSTYIGASKACAAAILQLAGVEALPARVGDRITGASDTINPNRFNEG